VPPFCRKTLRAIGAEGWDVAILFCDDGTIARLNGKYRGKNRPTDVLSFPRSRERGIVTGDIAISCDSLSRNAEAYGASEDSELRRLLIHGLLHLAGMDHGRGKGRGMLALQERIADRLDGEIIIRGKGA
jgi:probable rRNA maturation factor